MVATSPPPFAAGSYEDGPVGNSLAGSLFPRRAQHKPVIPERRCLAPDAQPSAKRADSTWTAILLADERLGENPQARHSGVPKALIRIGDRTLLRRAADTLLAAPEIRRIVVLAQQPDALLIDDAADLAVHPKVSLAVSGNDIASSISTIAGSALAPFPLLVTTVDHATLTPATLTEFLSAAGDCGGAVRVGERSGAKLFALRNLEAGAALGLWQGIERDRKRAWTPFPRFGLGLLVRALTRSIDIPLAVARAGQRLSLRAKPVVLGAPEAAASANDG
ncbi:MAG TPA: NTP transferase domain-containing protein [Croceibacterium sp.]